MKTLKIALAGCTIALAVAGCKKTADNSMNYKSAINTYYSAHPACLWTQPKQFPVQVGASDTDKTSMYDALVDQGLLVRSTSEKKIIVVSKRETNYDLSSNGHSAWTPDPSQPGFGNFCYGHRSVSSIDSATPNNGQPGATSTVSYHYSFSDAPSWAKNSEVQTAFPQVQTDLAGNGTATVTLVDTSNGWQVQAPPPSTNPATPADGSVVQ